MIASVHSVEDIVLIVCNVSANEYKECTDNHDSGYLGMAVQLFVQAHLGHYHILTQKEYSQKLISYGTAEIYAPFHLYMHNLNF